MGQDSAKLAKQLSTIFLEPIRILDLNRRNMTYLSFSTPFLAAFFSKLTRFVLE